MQVVRHLDEGLWKDFVDSNPLGNIFQTPEMFQVFERAKGHHPRLWAVIDSNGNKNEVMALLTLVKVTLIGGPLRPLTTRAIAYGSFSCDPAPRSRQALDVLLKAQRRDMGYRALFTELRHLFEMSAFESTLADNAYTYTDYLNYLIYLNKPEEEVWRAITKSGRKRIRQALKRGVEIEEIEDRDMVAVWYDLLQQTYARADIPLADLSLFEAVFDILAPKGMAKFLLAKIEGNYVAASLEMPYKDIIFSWYAGFDWEYRRFSPNDVLVWHILKWGVENDYHYYDFGGAGQPDQDYGVRDFKAKYGGDLVGFGRHVCVHAPLLLTVSKMGYRIRGDLNALLKSRE